MSDDPLTLRERDVHAIYAWSGRLAPEALLGASFAQMALVWRLAGLATLEIA